MSAAGRLHLLVSDRNAASWEPTVAGRGRPTPALRQQRVFDIDIAQCPNCGGTLKIIAAIEEPTVIARIPMHLGLPARAPPRSPARRGRWRYFRPPDPQGKDGSATGLRVALGPRSCEGRELPSTAPPWTVDGLKISSVGRNFQ